MDYQVHRKEFADLQLELNALDDDDTLSSEEYQIKYDDITRRRSEWYKRNDALIKQPEERA